MRTLLVTSQKKGVGKSAVSLHLASAVARNGYQVLFLDADPLSQVPDCFPNPAECLRDAGINLPGALLPSAMQNLDMLFPYAAGECSDQQLDLILSMVASGGLETFYQVVVINTPPFMGGNPGPFLRGAEEILLVVQTEPYANRTMPAFLNLLSHSSGAGRRAIDRYILTLPDGEVSNNRWEMELRGRFGKKVLSPLVSLTENSVVELCHAEERSTETDEAILTFERMASELSLTPSSPFHPPGSSIVDQFRQLFEEASRQAASPSRDKSIDSTAEFVLPPSGPRNVPLPSSSAPAPQPPPPLHPIYPTRPPLPSHAPAAVAAHEHPIPAVANPVPTAPDVEVDESMPPASGLVTVARLAPWLLPVFIIGAGIRYWWTDILRQIQPMMVGLAAGSSIFLVYWLLTGRKKPVSSQKSEQDPTPPAKSVMERRLDNIRQMHPPVRRDPDSIHHEDESNLPQRRPDSSRWDAHGSEEPPRKARPSFPGIMPPRN